MGKTEGTVAYTASNVYMSFAMPGIIKMADAVFLRSGTVIDVMQQMCLRQQGKRTKKRRTIDCRHLSFQVA